MPLDLYPASYDPNNPSTPAGMAPAIHGLTWTVLATPEFSTLNAVQSPNVVETRLPQTRNPIWRFTLVYDYLYARYRSPQNTYPFAPYSDLDTLMGFYLAHSGTLVDFLFDNPKDRTARGMLGGPWRPNEVHVLNDVRIDRQGHAQMVTVAGTSGANEPTWDDIGGTTVDGTATWTDQGYFPDGFPDAPAKLQLVTDGVGNYYTPVQRVLGELYYEDVTDLNGDLTVWADGVLQPTNNYTVLGPGVIVNDVIYAGLVLQWAAQPVTPITAKFNFYFRTCFESDTQDFEHFMEEIWTIGGSGSKSGSGILKLISARPVGPQPPPQALPVPKVIVSTTASFWHAFAINAGTPQTTARVFVQGVLLHASALGVGYGLRSDTYTLSPSDLATMNSGGEILASAYVDNPIGFSGTGGDSASLFIYDCYLNIVYEDGTTGQIRATSTSMNNDGIPGFGTISDPGNAIDEDSTPPTTFATLTRTLFDPLDFYNTFILHFQF